MGSFTIANGPLRQYTDDVISHVTALPEGKLKVNLEIRADVLGGADERTVPISSRDSNTFKIDNSWSEEG